MMRNPFSPIVAGHARKRTKRPVKLALFGTKEEQAALAGEAAKGKGDKSSTWWPCSESVNEKLKGITAEINALQGRRGTDSIPPAPQPAAPCGPQSGAASCRARKRSRSCTHTLMSYRPIVANITNATVFTYSCCWRSSWARHTLVDTAGWLAHPTISREIKAARPVGRKLIEHHTTSASRHNRQRRGWSITERY